MTQDKEKHINEPNTEYNKKSNNIIMEQEQKNEFCKIIKEFVPDLLHTFPEYKENLDNGIIDILQDDNTTDNVDLLIEYCKKVYPESFFDIIYQNETLFEEKKENEKEQKNTKFLPNIDFKDIWKQDISENTKNIIWKYLQLILLTILTSIKDKHEFGDTAKLFEAIDETEFKNKLEETISNMENIFDFSNNENDIDGSNINLDKLPDPEDIHNHINGMINGKLGNLAREIAEETAKEMNIDMNNISSVNDVFKQLFKNPSKLMGMVKDVGNKLENKIKTGDLKESELIQEATDMMSHMKNMPGMNNIQSLINNLGLPTDFGGKGGKKSNLNLGAMQSHMKQSLNQTKQRERMLEKLKQRQQQYINQKEPLNETKDNEQTYKFTKGEKPEKSKRKPKNNKNKKKKKHKK